jgi:2'-5' RNA ligase
MKTRKNRKKFKKNIYGGEDKENDIMNQVKKAKLTPEQNKLVNEYGIYWNLPHLNFNPHITLIYNSGENRKNAKGEFVEISKLVNNISIIKTGFRAENLALIELGEEGNALKLLNISPIKF